MAPAIGSFFEARNEALIANEMGLGEYTYLYTLGYYGFLGHDPDDGPVSELKEVEGVEDVQVQMGDINSSMRRVRRDLRTMLESQLVALAPLSDGGVDPEWYAALEEEVAALRSKRSRLPWQDGLPAPLEASFEPYRDQLEATYLPTANLFELMRNVRNGMSFTSE